MSGNRTLSRDYKHVKRHGAGEQAFSGWMGLMVGLAVGLSVALGVFLFYRNQPAAEPRAAAPSPPASQRDSTEAAPVPVDPAKDYTFYNDLPNQEVEIPTESVKANSAVTTLPTGDAVLQAGAFKQVGEAEKLQARLAQYGVDAKIQRFSLDDETWYRVRIGPIATVEELNAVRAKLADAEVEATPVASVVEVPPP